MSIIHTCYLCGADPIHYLTALQRYTAQVAAAPDDWMPWNYAQQLAAAETGSSRDPPRESLPRATSGPAR